MTKKTDVLNVGFDLDGVILYNPARILRPLIYLVKKIFFRKRLNKFWIPEKNWQKVLWRLAHKTSIFIAPGYHDIKKLVKENKIKAYLITARFSYLKNDLEGWLKKMKVDHVFTEIYYNKQDEQPHLFKEKIIKKLGLDIFVEDNWDIVEYLSQKSKIKSQKLHTKIFWIYNLFDRKINYQYKFPNLKEAINKIV